MRSNVFTSHGYALALILMLTVCFSAASLPLLGSVRAAQDQVVYLPLIMNGSRADTQPPSTYRRAGRDREGSDQFLPFARWCLAAEAAPNSGTGCTKPRRLLFAEP